MIAKILMIQIGMRAIRTNYMSTFYKYKHIDLLFHYLTRLWVVWNELL